MKTAVVRTTTRRELQAFIAERVRPQAMIYTDEHPAYHGCRTTKRSSHSVAQYLDGQAHTNGLESFWATLKHGYHGVHHHMSPKHLNRYVQKFARRHNIRPLDTIDQMGAIVQGLAGKRLRYDDLTAGGPAYPKR